MWIRLSALCCCALFFLLSHSAAAQHHGDPSIRLQRVASGLVSPIQLTAPDDGTGRRFVADQIGVVRILTREGRLLPAPFLDLRSEIVELKEQYDERGLLGLALFQQEPAQQPTVRERMQKGAS